MGGGERSQHAFSALNDESQLVGKGRGKTRGWGESGGYGEGEVKEERGGGRGG